MGYATILSAEDNQSGSWGVNCLYYGLTDEDGRPMRQLGSGRREIIKAARARWAIESLSPNTAAAAREILALEEAITDLVLAQRPAQAAAAAPYSGLQHMIWGRATADLLRFPEARLTARREADGWHISEFDFHAWSATLPAGGPA